MDLQPFVPHYGSGQLLAATTSPQVAAISQENRALQVRNDGPGIAYIRVAAGPIPAVRVSSADLPIPVGVTRTITKPIGDSSGVRWVLDYVSASTSSLSVVSGNGSSGDFGVGSGGSGGGGGTGLNGATQIEGFATTVDVSFTRPANTTAYAANQAVADAGPTAGGFTLANCSRAAGRSGLISDVVVASNADPATPLAGELWIYDQAVTAQADQAAFAPAAADRLKLVAVIPFSLASVAGGSGASGSVANVSGLSLGFTTVGSTNLRMLVKAKNAYVPASGEVLSVRLKIVQTN